MNDPKETLVLSKQVQKFNYDEQQSQQSKEAVASLEKNQEAVDSSSATVQATTATATTAAIVGGFVLGPLFQILLGALFKFFQVMDNIGNLQSINVGYGPLVSKLFDILDMIQISPDVESDTFMQAKERSLIKIFNKNFGKMSENFEDGFILMTVPLGTVLLLISFPLFNLVYHLLYLPFHKRVFTTHNPKKRLALLKSLKFRLCNKGTKLLYDLHMFVFNLYVLDLAGGSLYEIV